MEKFSIESWKFRSSVRVWRRIWTDRISQSVYLLEKSMLKFKFSIINPLITWWIFTCIHFYTKKENLFMRIQFPFLVHHCVLLNRNPRRINEIFSILRNSEIDRNGKQIKKMIFLEKKWEKIEGLYSKLYINRSFSHLYVTLGEFSFHCLLI